MLLLTARAARQAAGQSRRRRTEVIEDGLWRSGRTGMPSGPGVAQALDVGSALEGGKDFARERGSHKLQCTRWRDDESRASRVLRNDQFLLEVLVIPLNPPAQLGH